jgi:hypothetical protein
MTGVDPVHRLDCVRTQAGTLQFSWIRQMEAPTLHKLKTTAQLLPSPHPLNN